MQPGRETEKSGTGDAGAHERERGMQRETGGESPRAANDGEEKTPRQSNPQADAPPKREEVRGEAEGTDSRPQREEALTSTLPVGLAGASENWEERSGGESHREERQSSPGREEIQTGEADGAQELEKLNELFLLMVSRVRPPHGSACGALKEILRTCKFLFAKNPPHPDGPDFINRVFGFFMVPKNWGTADEEKRAICNALEEHLFLFSKRQREKLQRTIALYRAFSSRPTFEGSARGDTQAARCADSCSVPVASSSPASGSPSSPSCLVSASCSPCPPSTCVRSPAQADSGLAPPVQAPPQGVSAAPTEPSRRLNANAASGIGSASCFASFSSASSCFVKGDVVQPLQQTVNVNLYYSLAEVPEQSVLHLVLHERDPEKATRLLERLPKPAIQFNYFFVKSEPVRAPETRRNCDAASLAGSTCVGYDQDFREPPKRPDAPSSTSSLYPCFAPSSPASSRVTGRDASGALAGDETRHGDTAVTASREVYVASFPCQKEASESLESTRNGGTQAYGQCRLAGSRRKRRLSSSVSCSRRLPNPRSAQLRKRGKKACRRGDRSSFPCFRSRPRALQGELRRRSSLSGHACGDTETRSRSHGSAHEQDVRTPLHLRTALPSPSSSSVPAYASSLHSPFEAPASQHLLGDGRFVHGDGSGPGSVGAFGAGAGGGRMQLPGQGGSSVYSSAPHSLVSSSYCWFPSYSSPHAQPADSAHPGIAAARGSREAEDARHGARSDSDLIDPYKGGDDVHRGGNLRAEDTLKGRRHRPQGSIDSNSSSLAFASSAAAEYSHYRAGSERRDFPAGGHHARSEELTDGRADGSPRWRRADPESIGERTEFDIRDRRGSRRGEGDSRGPLSQTRDPYGKISAVF
ncbi:conserved hypothetical protein [Neospora caninum Liverpool]|uniref:Uncharacterized protein n=1 Tax=Neospora caninum (strain Liverpool) TaxID=572307 RepID=F0VQS1_NEOCL|nr:conserved hypothetical protein [Neospora caninum Liverpool]CBZ56068.1 conserved hypothetical protein [Neospora caninum Liverpool]CEL70816.1 TPA: hypothetical protein BN1204_064940 [Neospora caninum Liverpool]|eukprot:XP_003886094.1 conserved hypothetical protein [Neospora caninum Liverpool]